MSEDVKEVPIEAVAGKNILTTKIRDKDYKLTPFTITDLAEFQNYIKNQKHGDVLKLKESLEPEQFMELLLEVVRKPVEDINAEMKTIEGVRYLLWLALRKHQPKIDLIAAGNLIAIDNMTDVGVLIDKLMSSPGEAKKETPAKPNPTEKV